MTREEKIAGAQAIRAALHAQAEARYPSRPTRILPSERSEELRRSREQAYERLMGGESAQPPPEAPEPSKCIQLPENVYVGRSSVSANPAPPARSVYTPKRGTPTVVISSRFPVEYLEALDAYAETNNLTRSQAVIALLVEALEGT